MRPRQSFHFVFFFSQDEFVKKKKKKRKNSDRLEKTIERAE